MANAVRTLVLLVDDVPDQRDQYERALKGTGFAVLSARSGAQALEHLSQVVPRCVVIDERLPDMSGWELCREVKGLAPTKHLPVIVLTQAVNRAAVGRSVAVGCSAWMAHPSAAADLVRAVGYVISSDKSVPDSGDEALLGVRACVACGAEHVRATLRLDQTQYYRCRACGYSWRLDVAPA